MGLFDQKKHLLVLFGSPNSHGNTRMLLESFLDVFKEQKGWAIDEIDTYTLNAHPCTGCRACAKKEGCQFSDLDGFDSFPAPLKAVLDRTQRYFEARFSLGMRTPIKKRRQAVLLLAMGQEEDFPVEVTVHQLERAFSVMNTQLCGCAVWGGTDRGRQNQDPAQQKARALALEMLGQI